MDTDNMDNIKKLELEPEKLNKLNTLLNDWPIERIVACTEACEGISDISVVKDAPKLLEALTVARAIILKLLHLQMEYGAGIGDRERVELALIEEAVRGTKPKTKKGAYDET